MTLASTITRRTICDGEQTISTCDVVQVRSNGMRGIVYRTEGDYVFYVAFPDNTSGVYVTAELIRIAPAVGQTSAWYR